MHNFLPLNYEKKNLDIFLQQVFNNGMKKIITILFIVFPLSASAMLMGFSNDHGLWDETGKQLYTCFNDTPQTCIGLDDKTYLKSDLLDSNPVDTPYYPPENPPVVQPAPIGVIPDPIPQPPVAAAPSFTPFNGSPYKITEYYNTLENRLIYSFGVDLVREEKLSKDKYKAFCITPNYPEGRYFETVPGLNNPKGYTQRVGEVDSNKGYGHYACKFVFTLPEGTLESGVLEFDLQ